MLLNITHKYPIKTEILVLPADTDHITLGFVCYEKLGGSNINFNIYYYICY